MSADPGQPDWLPLLSSLFDDQDQDPDEVPARYEGGDDRSHSPAMERIRPGLVQENIRANGGYP
ncbi:hypothetical protein PUR57_35435 [Streptomyces sp. JV176]|uniref:hypothetical protein n=1 Tax=Streptomyces sp. JV176 TaxID=858630 RepID=UPI002E79923F|nr:hypothetical protein [Streptomyces sp. JV176]MEE1803905.1 hypothetical protein [Streptomyces sp. JV176]